jgi:hypothetical protein
VICYFLENGGREAGVLFYIYSHIHYSKHIAYIGKGMIEEEGWGKTERFDSD